MNPIRKQFQYGDRTVIMETGEIARQAHGAVMIDIEGTTLAGDSRWQKRTQRWRFFPRSPLTIWKRPMPRVKFPVDFLSAKVVPANKKPSFPV